MLKFPIAKPSNIMHNVFMKFVIQRKPEFKTWLKSQTEKSQGQVEARLSRIEKEAHFGHIRDLGDGLAELKFNDGRRIYFARTGQNEITLISGGNKNGQSKDIKKAKKLLG